MKTETILETDCIYDLCDGREKKNYWADIFKTKNGFYIGIYDPDIKANNGLFQITEEKYNEYFKTANDKNTPSITTKEFDNLYIDTIRKMNNLELVKEEIK